MGASHFGCGKALIMQFAKAPVIGQVKTRMIPHLSAGQAADLHTELLIWTANTLCSDRFAETELWLTGDVGSDFSALTDTLGFDAIKTQWGEDLGERMSNAIADGLNRCEKVLIIGSDCPSLDKSYLRGAIEALDDSDVVIGPAHDGGYVLIGSRVSYPRMFRAVNWGQSTVMRETSEILDAGNVLWKAMPALGDIDRPEDLPAWYRLKNKLGS